MTLSKLTDAGEESIFSFRLRSDLVSWVDIGTPDQNQNKEEPATFDVNNDFFWSTTMGGVRFGTKGENAYTFSMMEEGAELNGGIYTIFDTGASDIYLSLLWYEDFVAQLYAATGTEYEIKDGVTTGACTNFPDLYFLVDNYWWQVKDIDYV